MHKVDLKIFNIDLDDFCALHQSTQKEKLCQNGECIVDTSKINRGYICKCKNGYFGDSCEQINACLLNENGKNGNQICNETNSGACVRTFGNNFRCDCNGDSDKLWDKDTKR